MRAKAILAVYFLVAAWAIALFMTRPANPPFPLAVLHGEAPAPMAYRVLSPLCMGAISKLTGDWAKAEFIFYFLAAVFAQAATWAWMRKWSALGADLVPIILAGILFTGVVPRTSYDLAGLGFVSLLLWAAIEKRWLLYAAALMSGTFNRETTYLAILALPALHGWTKETAKPAAVAVFAWLVAKAALWWALADVSGGMPFQLLNNLRVLAGLTPTGEWSVHPQLAGWRFLQQTQFMHAMLAVGGLWLLIPLRWRGSPLAARRLILYVLPLHLLAVALTGSIVETRVYLDLLPIVLPIIFGREG